MSAVMEAEAQPVLGNVDLLDATPPIEQQIGWLDQLSDDVETYALLWLAAMQTIAVVVRLELRPGQPEVLNLGIRDEAMTRDTSIRINLLVEHMHSAAGRREAIVEALRSRGAVNDFLPADTRGTTAAIRGFLAIGGWVMIDSDGGIETGGLSSRLLDLATPEMERANLIAAGRRMNDAVQRYANRSHIKRVIRRFGLPTSNGWLVLGGRS
ncbi:hypothetical protein PQ455_07305 [Sphingomonas naphthae]|uniref:Uncharacterized protein n=1 Tax=Sphingomonas naphthae TaxID=1813468 RepID=A0ABY7TPZ7_9SPHN|nr:hypothetical protein [Sphingomonas naphthae]WCT75015.1 hypothetical protein PQ455_07305 [Sphingomonas naphthae]